MKTFPRQAVASACLVLLLTATASVAPAQSRQSGPPPGYIQIGKPDQAEGKKVLEEFRKTGWGLAGAYYLDFELRVLPRRGDERTVPGRLWGSRNERGPITRVVLQPGVKDAERRLLVQVGPESAVWSWPAQPGFELLAAQPNGVENAGPGLPAPGLGQRVSELGTAALFAPLAGTDLTAFDLQMPFLYWKEFTFEGVAPAVRGRPARVFLLRPPAAVTAQRPELSGVRVFLDTQFNALVQAEELGRDGKPLKTITVLDLKKVGEQWIVKTIDVRDEATRNKTQFAVTGAALGQEFSAVLFEPARLADAIAPPPADRVQKIEP